ncbi:MAG: hypothetical protein J0L74_11905, partial [Burkholderiales bacterium]|nr:hypothetical protein [Burkholderiales bacterium]
MWSVWHGRDSRVCFILIAGGYQRCGWLVDGGEQTGTFFFPPIPNTCARWLTLEDCSTPRQLSSDLGTT